MITQEFIDQAIERAWKNNPDAPIFDTESELYRDIHRNLDPINFGYYGEVGGIGASMLVCAVLPLIIG